PGRRGDPPRLRGRHEGVRAGAGRRDARHPLRAAVHEGRAVMAQAAVRTAVIDYGAGNIHIIARALSLAGLSPIVATDPGQAEGAELLVLPGQGRFGQVATMFRASG